MCLQTIIHSPFQLWYAFDMSETKQERIVKKVLEILENYPSGMRYTHLFRELAKVLPDVAQNTIHGTIWNLDKRNERIVKPERGLWILQKYTSSRDSAIKKDMTYDVVRTQEKSDKLPSEESFYQPFADYLVQDLEECTKTIPLGGNKFGDKWGTPDVLGVYKFSETDPMRPPVEIVSAEIKTDTNQLITAFGQACAYKIFSHKVYLVVPKDAERDVSRVESLCARFGIGLILFDRNNSQNPHFEIRTRAAKSEPDYFYVNEYLQKLGENKKLLF